MARTGIDYNKHTFPNAAELLNKQWEFSTAKTSKQNTFPKQEKCNSGLKMDLSDGKPPNLGFSWRQMPPPAADLEFKLRTHSGWDGYTADEFPIEISFVEESNPRTQNSHGLCCQR